MASFGAAAHDACFAAVGAVAFNKRERLASVGPFFVAELMMFRSEDRNAAIDIVSPLCWNTLSSRIQPSAVQKGSGVIDSPSSGRMTVSELSHGELK
jgi:hypothetical protein